MSSFLAMPWLVAIFLSFPWAEGRKEPGENALSISIVPGKDKSGSSIIDRDGVFQVAFTNRSSKPIRLWTQSCQPGYEALFFRVEDGEGQSWLMYKAPRYSWDWKNTPLKTFAIPPSGTLSWEVAPSAIWGERTWKGVPEPNTGRAITLTAIFEIKPSDAAKEQGVWTGRITSEPIQTLVVDPKLQSPHQYLEEDCPKQALGIMQADRTWISRKDKSQETPLHIAARHGYREVVRWLLSHGAQVNARAYNDFTPLHFAKEPEIVKLLLEFKADVNAKDASGGVLQRAASEYAHLGQYPDYAAARKKWRIITKILLDAGAEYDLPSACYLGDVKRVQALLADKEQVGDKYAMRVAAQYGQAKIVKLLLEHGADPEDADFGGLTVSYFAIKHPDVLRLLFEAGADPKIPVDYHGSGHGPEGSTLLHEAAEKGIVESAKLLMTRGVAVDVTTPQGTTPLHVACRKGHTAMVDWLLQNKADAKARNSTGWTPMGLAASQVTPEHDDDNARYQAVIRRLERAGVEVDVFAAIACNDVQRVAVILRTDAKAGMNKDARGKPALHRAVMLDRRQMVKQFLDRGCDPEVASEDENSGRMETALHEAAFWGRLEIAKILIKYDANVNARAAHGVVPLHEAARTGHLELVELFLNNGATVNAKNDEGETPLDWAEKGPEMSKLLRSHGGQKKNSK